MGLPLPPEIPPILNDLGQVVAGLLGQTQAGQSALTGTGWLASVGGVLIVRRPSLAGTGSFSGAAALARAAGPGGSASAGGVAPWTAAGQTGLGACTSNCAH